MNSFKPLLGCGMKVRDLFQRFDLLQGGDDPFDRILEGDHPLEFKVTSVHDDEWFDVEQPADVILRAGDPPSAVDKFERIQGGK